MSLINPTKIVCVAENYPANNRTSNASEPIVFLKGRNCLNLDNRAVSIPFDLPCWGECELGFIVKKTAKNIKLNDADEFILGYTLANDVTIQNIAGRDHHLARSKSADEFCPVFPSISATFKPQNQVIRGYHNDLLLRESTLDTMIWSPQKILSEVSAWMTLEEGDLILTGAPPRVRDRIFLAPGDTYRCEIDELGMLETRFR